MQNLNFVNGGTHELRENGFSDCEKPPSFIKAMQ